MNKLLLTLSIFLLSCSPKVNNKNLTPSDSINKPELSDINSLVQPATDSGKIILNWEGDVPTATINLAIKDLIELGQSLNDTKLKTIAIKFYNKLYRSEFTWGEKFENSPYMDLFRFRARPEVQKEITTINSEIDKNLKTTKKLVTSARNRIQWPEQANFDESLSFLEKVLEDLDSQITSATFYPEFKSELSSQFKIEKTNNMKYLKNFSAELKSDISLSFLINQIKKLAQEYSYTFDGETKLLLNKATALGKSIDRIKDAESALAAILEVWLFLDKPDREKEIKPISESLFKFLNKKKEDDIKCLISRRCADLWDSLIKNIFILPKITNYGVKNIQNKLNERSYHVALDVLNKKFYETISAIDVRINSMIEKGVIKGKEKLIKISSNMEKYVDSKLLDWIKIKTTATNNTFNTFQWPITRVTKSANNGFIFTSLKKDNYIQKDTIGTSLQLTKVILTKTNLNDNSLRKLLIEQINNLFALGGVPDEFPDGSIFKKGLIRSLQSPNQDFNLTKAISSQESFSLEDRFLLASPYTRGSQPDYFKLSANSTAQFILGLVELVDYFKDWQNNNFDDLLGAVTPSEIFQSEASPTEEPIFSKSKLFGYVTGHLANILSNFNKTTTPIALVNSSNEITWSNNISSTTSNAFLYSLFVNVENNTKAETMNLEDMTLLISVLARLVEAVEGIEYTKFSGFTKPLADLQGKSVVQVIKENIQKVSRAFIPLGNTIATKMKRLKDQSEAGLIFNQININTFQNFSSKYYLSDQLKAIEAMLLVYEKTKIESYQWAALETFNYLQRFYNPKTNYFHFNDEQPTVPNALQLLKTMIKIKPFLSQNEQVIVDERIGFLKTALLSIK